MPLTSVSRTSLSQLSPLFFALSVFPSHICSFPSACKLTQHLSHPNEPSLDLRFLTNLISLFMPSKLLKSSLSSPSPPAHLPPSPPSLQPGSAASPLYWHSRDSTLCDFKLPNRTDIFSVLISLSLCIWEHQLCYDSCSSLLPWLNSPYILDYCFSFSFIFSTFLLNINIPWGSFLGLCSSHFAHSLSLGDLIRSLNTLESVSLA